MAHTGKVKAALATLYDLIQRMTPTADGKDNDNVKYLKSVFDVMTDKEVIKFAGVLRDTGMTIPFTSPNWDKANTPKMEDLLRVAEDLGIELYQRIWKIEEDGTAYLSPTKRLVGTLYARRQNQTAMHSAGYADQGNTINTLTGQVTGASKVTRLSFMESMLINQYSGMAPVLQELLQFRGGDPTAHRAMRMMLASTGYADHARLSSLGSTARINTTLSAYLLGAHLNSTLTKTATNGPIQGMK